MSVPVHMGSSFESAPPHRLFDLAVLTDPLS